MRMDTLLPDWLEKGVESSLRDTEDEAAPALPLASAQVLSIAGGRRGRSGSGVVTPVVLMPSGESSPANSQIRGIGGGGSTSKGAWMDLDKFYADTEEGEEESEEEDGEEEGAESEEGEGDEEEGEGEGEDHSASGGEPEDSEDDHESEENHTEGQAYTAGVSHLALS